MHLVAADTCQKENLLMRREQLHRRCRLIKHCSLLASDWPAHDRGDGETALCLSLITRQDAEVNKLVFLSNTDISSIMPCECGYFISGMLLLASLIFYSDDA